MPRTRSLTTRTLPLALAIALLLAVAQFAAAGPVVELYVTSWCPYCTKTKAYFDGKGIPYTVYDIDKDPAANMRFKRYGGRGVPLVMIDGAAIAGYSVAEFEKALAAPKTAQSHPKIATP
ncbi:glutaredoxin family protein [Desulfovibrio sp. TomC]|uniref:glutaredoxin family protein n=1 Tax=Desulfovibrio sp. TomC TaxID=1562888 RepID=UPI000573997A|nr:glutaredoxin domain-containing protein [Desulfovibrio sp. TomC]KHK01212.1 glutaredoxin family protein [Desulfovibrio sp. TomC]